MKTDQQHYPDDALAKPPFNADAEVSVIGGVFHDVLAFDRIASLVGEDDFFISRHQLIFAAQRDLIAANEPVDAVTVGEYLDARGLLDDAGGMAQLVDLVRNSAGAANVVRYAQIVREHAVIRRMVQVCHEVGDRLYKRGGMSARELLDMAQSRWMQVGESLAKSGDTTQTIAQVMDSVLPALDDLYQNPVKSDVTGLATGLVDLDKMTTGFQPGDLVILAGRPSMGKTSLAMNMVEHACLNDKKNAAIFSLEMGNDQLGVRMLASVSKLNQSRVKVARLNEAEMHKLSLASERLRTANMFLDEQSGLSVNDIRARARRIHRECDGGLDLIVIDYLQLMTFDGDVQNEAVGFSMVSRGLKGLAKELQVPVVVLSQLNRALEQRPNKRPIMSDLRGSGGIEQDADIILFIYRDEVYHENSEDRGTAEVIIGKQRNGPIGTVRTAFVSHLMRFENFADYPADDSVEI